MFARPFVEVVFTLIQQYHVVSELQIPMTPVGAARYITYQNVQNNRCVVAVQAQSGVKRATWALHMSKSTSINPQLIHIERDSESNERLPPSLRMFPDKPTKKQFIIRLNEDTRFQTTITSRNEDRRSAQFGARKETWNNVMCEVSSCSCSNIK
jgi:hypothetical protein